MDSQNGRSRSGIGSIIDKSVLERGLDPRLHPLRRQLWLTRIGLFCQTVLRSFWPLMSLILFALALVMLGGAEFLPLELVWGGGIGLLAAALAAVFWAIKQVRWIGWTDAQTHLDRTLAGRPIAALLDAQIIGHGDAQSERLWALHQQRMAQRAAQSVAVAPDLRLASADPFGLRFAAMLCFVVALLFGSVFHIHSLRNLTSGPPLALTGPTWEGWLEPPLYTGLPVIYLADQSAQTLKVAADSRISLRFYGDVGDLTLSETVSGRVDDLPPAEASEQNLTVTQSGSVAIDGPGGRSWDVQVIPDLAPRVAVAAQPELSNEGSLQLLFQAQDDYGVAAGQVRIELDLLALDRRNGLEIVPDARPDILLDLPLPLTGDRRDFTEMLVEDFSQHPWANMPMVYHFSVQDAADQRGQSGGFGAPLTARRFFDPLAAALIEQRRDLLWARANGLRVTQILRALSHRPADLIPNAGDYLRLRAILRQLEAGVAAGLQQPQQEEVAQALWDLAIQLEEGDIGDALDRMRRAQERLNQAMRDGASDQEIARLMQDLREATEDYLRQLQRQAQNDGDRQDGEGQSQSGGMQMTQQDLQALMDRIQDLMEQGRMAEAEQALREFQELMENMQVTEGGQGQGNSPGEQAMQGLADTLRQQQGLSDQAFRDLQEQFNPDAQLGQNQGNEGRDGGLGRGESHDQGGGSQGEGNSGQGNQGAPQPGADGAQSLAEQQENLRRELQRQQGGLPFSNAPEGEDMRDALDRAGRAMDDAEQALRQGDLAEAIDRQSEAMESLRESMRALGEAMAMQQGGENSTQPSGQTAQGDGRDPLGRGTADSGDQVGDGQAHRRAWDLFEDIRRRSEELERSQSERNYLQRLLDRF